MFCTPQVNGLPGGNGALRGPEWRVAAFVMVSTAAFLVHRSSLDLGDRSRTGV